MAYSYFLFGTPGESTSTRLEHRIHEDLNMFQKFGSRVNVSHRIRYEQRWIENEKFRPRIRYKLGASVPINNKNISDPNTFYATIYDEVHLTGQKDTGITEVDKQVSLYLFIYCFFLFVCFFLLVVLGFMACQLL